MSRLIEAKQGGNRQTICATSSGDMAILQDTVSDSTSKEKRGVAQTYPEVWVQIKIAMDTSGMGECLCHCTIRATDEEHLEEEVVVELKLCN